MVLKRKTSAHVVCIDTKKTAAPKRQPTKADLLQELKDMKKLNDTLELENVKNLKVIKILEKKNLFLEINRKSESSVKELKDDGTQTELDRPIFCYECDFPAEDYHDLGEHMMEFHAFACKTCAESFMTKKVLMNMNKSTLKKHPITELLLPSPLSSLLATIVKKLLRLKTV